MTEHPKDGDANPVLGVERAGHVATLWLDRPEKRNAMGMAFFAELPPAMADLGADDDVRAIVVAARGPAFTVGLDLTSLGGVVGEDPTPAGASSEHRRPSEARRASKTLQNVRSLQAAISSVADCPKPVVAAVHGWCIGGGVDLVTACDIRLCSSDAVFSVRETRMAMVADLGTLQRLPLILPAGRVAELAYTGKDVDAALAERIGLVNGVYEDAAAVQAAARELAEEIAANPPLAVQGTKAVLSSTYRAQVQAGLEYVATWNAGQLRSHDLIEAVTAFFERRPPKFTGE
jgi:enoyl-CoA hydratase